MRLAVIPARGGSKRIPRKNIRIFIDKPIIAYSILAAKASGCFDKIIVSTDDEEIAEISKKYGAEVPFIRPENLSDDYTGTNAVVKHAIQWYEENGKKIEYVCCIYATAPFLKANYIKKGFNTLIELNSSFAFSVTKFDAPIQRALRILSDGKLQAIWHENENARSQDLEDCYHDAGQFYWGTSSAFLNEISIFTGHSVPIVLPKYLVQDIDTEEDWLRAEMMFKASIS